MGWPDQINPLLETDETVSALAWMRELGAADDAMVSHWFSVIANECAEAQRQSHLIPAVPMGAEEGEWYEERRIASETCRMDGAA